MLACLHLGSAELPCYLPTLQARKCIRKGDLESLIKADELVNMLTTRRAFQVRGPFEWQRTVHHLHTSTCK